MGSCGRVEWREDVWTPGPRLITCESHTWQNDLDTVIESTTVFYRTSPRHKLTIIQAFQRVCFGAKHVALPGCMLAQSA
jgi:magnesium-transporting ATPase (P-type)